MLSLPILFPNTAMPILEVEKHDNRQLQNVANYLAVSKKVVVITGAGISTNCGIPVCHVDLAEQRWSC